MNIPEIFADFNNADTKGRIRLNTNGSINNFKTKDIQLKEGMQILINDGDGLSNLGRLKYSEEENIWVAEIGWDDMIPKPTIGDTQFAVLTADGATGHVLNTKGDLYLSDNSLVYLIFDDVNLAREHIKQGHEKNDTLEFTIFNSKYEFVEFWEAPKWSA